MDYEKKVCYLKIIYFSDSWMFRLLSSSLPKRSKHLYRNLTNLTIGSVSKACPDPKNPELVPKGFAVEKLSQTSLRHIQWLLQKDLMEQDVFLIGHPGPTRRRIVLQFLELSNREYEYLAISRDTTDADLKQRRELIDGSSVYSDSAAVRAAIHWKNFIKILEYLTKWHEFLKHSHKSLIGFNFRILYSFSLWKSIDFRRH